jgi:hypothetical protein
MIVDAIKDVSRRNGIVLDLFGGSGSTLIAAHKTGRRARLCELDPIYCDRILQRWEGYARDDAELITRREAARLHRVRRSGKIRQRRKRVRIRTMVLAIWLPRIWFLCGSAPMPTDKNSGLKPPPGHPDYEVGYSKPPKASRFARGQSGNRKGRPKGARNELQGPKENHLQKLYGPRRIVR